MKITLRALAATALACASLSLAGAAHAADDPSPVKFIGGNLQVSGDAIKARCLSKDISGEDKGSPEEGKKPLKEEKCPPLALAGTAGGALGQDEEGEEE
ncbi:hypothetical protein [Streptomyces sp. NPDC059874]|uniref:hypothetical protein n=1 Tax=Streptomyces sp. NPDC059874 TaxID=3346983 RepID=UPI003658BECC